jgi:para-aminobenzoate synthetase component 1
VLISKIANLLTHSEVDFALLLSNAKKHNVKVNRNFLLGIDLPTSLNFNQKPKDVWKFGLIEYPELGQKGEIQTSKKYFFETSTVFEDPKWALECLQTLKIQIDSNQPLSSRKIKINWEKEKYLNQLNKIKEHIKAGDIYELNYCIIHQFSDFTLEPDKVFQKLNEISGAPYSVFARLGDKFILSASPERFVRKTGTTIEIHPMKGTAPRHPDQISDENNKENLKVSEKERAENIMIVDLTRNDLSKICKPGSVKVDELCGVHSFQNVHQLVSVVSGKLEKEIELDEILKAIFPMGSMTGAPKTRAMELIQKFEEFNRKQFSGSFGYVQPNGNFDFNVLIRSIFFDAKNKELYFATGGAITINSDPEAEWAEMQLKAETLLKALG